MISVKVRSKDLVWTSFGSGKNAHNLGGSFAGWENTVCRACTMPWMGR